MQISRLFLFWTGLLFTTPGFAQKTDSINNTPADTVIPGTQDTTKKTAANPTETTNNKNNKSEKPTVYKDSARLVLESLPRKAAWSSAMLPGLGQIKNKRWWKVPLIYGGFVGIGLMYEFNQRYYQIFLKEVKYRLTHNQQPSPENPQYAGLSYDGMVNAKDFYRRNRDFSILLGVGFYAIQIIDAYVDAKFFRYDISNDLSLKIEPSLQLNPVYNAYIAPAAGIKFKLSL